METWGFTFTFLLLVCGITLTVITIHRMAIGAISIPQWAKIALVLGMILMQLILLLSLLPPMKIDNIFVNESTSIVYPVDPDVSIQTEPLEAN